MMMMIFKKKKRENKLYYNTCINIIKLNDTTYHFKYT